MFLRPTTRKKDGKVHRTWSVVENRRVRGGRTVQHTVLYLGEINDSQREGWNRAIDAVVGRSARQIRLFPADREPPPADTPGIRVRMDRLELRRPRQWGACWLALELWDRLGLDGFWRPRLPPSREGTRWLNVLKTLVAYRLIDPGSEFRLHRDWYRRTAMADLLGEDFRLAAKDTLYRCLDRLLDHRDDLFGHLAPKWTELFGARHDVLLYDLTSTYFEIDAPAAEEDKRRHGHSRDRRPDCVQVVIGLVVTPEGFPLAYEVFAGNTRDTATLRDFLKRIEAHILVAFLAYALQVTLRNLIREHAGGLTPRRVLDQLAGIQMLDVVAPTTDGRWLTMPRFTQPERSQQVLLARLGLALPPQPPPRIQAAEPPPPD